MKLILKERVENLGELGSLVNVKPGYARNFLVPFGKAVVATEQNIKAFEQKRSELEKKEADKLATAQSVAEKVDGNTISLKVQAGEGGRLFGSIGTRDIASLVSEKFGISVERKNVRLNDGIIRQIGEYSIGLHLHVSVDASFTLVVEGEQ